jgi:hypothetical protein
MPLLATTAKPPDIPSKFDAVQPAGCTLADAAGSAADSAVFVISLFELFWHSSNSSSPPVVPHVMISRAVKCTSSLLLVLLALLLNVAAPHHPA